MRKYLFAFLSIVALIALVGCGNAGDPDPDSTAENGSDKPTITLGKAPYEHISFINGVIKHVAEQQGYSIDITEGDVGVMYLGVSQGEIDVYADAWDPTLHGPYIEKYKNDMEIIGMLYEQAPLGWAVPSYVDIESIEDLKGREDEFKGRIVGIEPSAGMMLTSEEIIEGYELDYELLNGSTIGMLTELQRAINNEEPMVFLAWRPHTMFQQFDIKLLEDPKGFWQYDDIKVAVANGFKEKAPDLYRFLENLKIDIEDIEAGMLRFEEGEDPEQVTKEWVEEHRAEIDQWLES